MSGQNEEQLELDLEEHMPTAMTLLLADKIIEVLVKATMNGEVTSVNSKAAADVTRELLMSFADFIENYLPQVDRKSLLYAIRKLNA